MQGLIDQLRPELAARDQIRAIMTELEYFRTIPADVYRIIQDMVPCLRKSHDMQKMNADFNEFLQKYQKIENGKPKIIVGFPYGMSSPVLDINKLSVDFPQCTRLTRGNYINVKKIGNHILVDACTDGSELKYLGQNNGKIMLLSTNPTEQFWSFLTMDTNTPCDNTNGWPKYDFTTVEIEKDVWYTPRQVLPCNLAYSERKTRQFSISDQIMRTKEFMNRQAQLPPALIDFATGKTATIFTNDLNPYKMPDFVEVANLTNNTNSIIDDFGNISGDDNSDVLMFSDAWSIFYSVVVE